jgi:hypothetical protein
MYILFLLKLLSCIRYQRWMYWCRSILLSGDYDLSSISII